MKVFAAFTNAQKELEKMLRDQPDYAEAICALGVIDAALENKGEAIREGQRAVELMPVSKNAIEGPLLIKYLALVYAWTGEKDRAFERLDEAGETSKLSKLRPTASPSHLGAAARRPALRKNCHLARAEVSGNFATKCCWGRLSCR